MKRALLIPALSLLVATMVGIFASCNEKLEGPKNVNVESSELTYCGADQQAFVVRGSGLSPLVVEGATDKPGIRMPKVCMTKVADASGTALTNQPEQCIAEEDVQWISQNEIRFIVRTNTNLTPGEYEVVITNPDGTKASGGTIRLKVLAEGPIVFWADPSVVYNDISTQITVYGANLGTIDTVAVRDSESFEETILCGGGGEGGSNPCEEVSERENRVQAVVPRGLPAAADNGPKQYDVVVRSANGCQAELIRGLSVTARVDLVVSSIDPKFGWTDAPTPVTVFGEGFQAVPRVYLNPQNPGPGTTASALSSVAMVDDATLTAVVPTGFQAGLYDVIVVNADGSVGIIEDGFTITAQPPPVVANISPNYIFNGSAQQVTVEGSNFRNPTVTLLCQNPDGTQSEPTATVNADPTASSFDATLNVADLPDGAVCVVTITNDDQSYSVYSAVGISNPSLNLNAFSAGTDMLTARRAPAVIAARATSSARFIYAIGGDDGSAAGALDTVETTTIDIFGNPGTWFQQPVSLPSPRTLSAVTKIGRFLYLVGGNDGQGPTASVLRAEVLNPLAAPVIVDVAGERGAAGEGIGAGVWYYRVSAVMADTDPSNPGGETLASDPLAVNLSAEFEGTLVLTLFWDEIPGAAGYRVYRSPAGTENVGEVQLVAEVDGGSTTSYRDAAASGATQNESPRPLGATGNWMALGDLAGAREAAGAAAGVDPENPNQWYVYAVGGRAGAALNTTEQLNVAVDPVTGVQTAATWVAGANISTARSELTAWGVTHSEAKDVPIGTTYVYAGGGTESTSVDTALIPAGGALTWLAAQQMSPQRAGYAGVAGAGFIIAFGGQNSAPDDGITKGVVSTDPGAAYIENWNAEGATNLLVPRYLAGGAVESAFVYIIGGVTPTGVVASTERTVL